MWDIQEGCPLGNKQVKIHAWIISNRLENYEQKDCTRSHECSGANPRVSVYSKQKRRLRVKP